MALGGEYQNISFWCGKARALWWERRREEKKKKREEEKKKKKSRFGTCVELFGTLVWKLILVGLEHLLCLELLFGNYMCRDYVCKSLFVQVV